MVNASMGTNADMHTERQSLRKGKNNTLMSLILGVFGRFKLSLFETFIITG